MDGEGPFLAIRAGGPPGGFHHPPRGGFCVNVFVFVTRGSTVLLGRMREHPAWRSLAGADPERVRRWATGWTIPGTQLQLGEHPSEGARRILRDLLGLEALDVGEPAVFADYDHHPDLADLPRHFDLSFHFDVRLPEEVPLTLPPWYASLRFLDPRSLAPSDYARQHQDVMAQWREAHDGA